MSQKILRNEIAHSFMPIIGTSPVEWRIEEGLTPYPQALEIMEKRVSDIHTGLAHELIWLVEHPPLYTAGTSAQKSDLLTPDLFPVYEAGRGGEFTYHGPGQRVVYVMLNLKRRREDVRAFVSALEEWIIQTLAHFNVQGERREDRVGVWVIRKDRLLLRDGSPAEDKIAAIGIRLRKWISFHGIAINLEPNLSHYNGIIPCGIAEHGVTSLVDLELTVTMSDLDFALKQAFKEIFGAVEGD